jgi:hypothetical protein
MIGSNLILNGGLAAEKSSYGLWTLCRSSPNYLFRRKEFGLSAYWPGNAECLATALIML